MRAFDQLTLDEQMKAVENAVDEIILFVLDGKTPICFKQFQYEIDRFHKDEGDEAKLREMIYDNHFMKVAMLHQAGKTAMSKMYEDKK